jgi:hypothetical protein
MGTSFRLRSSGASLYGGGGAKKSASGLGSGLLAQGLQSTGAGTGAGAGAGAGDQSERARQLAILTAVPPDISFVTKY